VSEAPSETLIRQRIRNRRIEVLELAASFAEQAAYQSKVLHINVPAEVLNQWEDWLQIQQTDDGTWTLVLELWPETFSSDEAEALRSFHATWGQTCEQNPTEVGRLDKLVHEPIWEQFRAAAETALKVMMVRGKSSEEEIRGESGAPRPTMQG
jgi:hypothetical protein